MGKCPHALDWLQEWVAKVPDAPKPPLWVGPAACVAYLVAVLAGERFMRKRAPLKLNTAQAVHNGLLFVYSLVSSVAMVYVTLCNTPYKTVDEVMCDSRNAMFSGFNSWVLFLFMLSKIWEFGDTAFLVLGKHRLRFLHVYHHAVTLALSWIMYLDTSSSGALFAWTNMVVHTPMYYYYTIFALGRTVWWKKYITQIQITQFVLCLVAMLYEIFFLLPPTSTRCERRKEYAYHSIYWAIATYITFLALFIKLYIDVYKSRASNNKKTDGDKKPKAAEPKPSTPAQSNSSQKLTKRK